MPKCEIEWCQRNSKNGGYGLCSMHVYRKAKGIHEDTPPLRGQGSERKVKTTCKVDACEGITLAQGMCTIHYQRWLRGADLTKPKLGSLEFKRKCPNFSKKELRRKVVAYLGGVCALCGFGDSRALQVDHIKGGGVRHRKMVSYSHFCRGVLVGQYDGEVQLLCANCNWIKVFENQELRRQ